MRIEVISGLCFLAFLSPACSDGSVEYETVDVMTAGIFLDEDTRDVLPAGVEHRLIYPKGLDLTKLSEGFRENLYNDAAGYCTIAYGHLLKKAGCDGSEPEEMRRGLPEPLGAELLRKDMAIAERAVSRYVSVDMTDGQYASLCDFVYNVGSGNFRSSTLLKVVNAGNQDEVPTQLRRWVRAGGRVLEGLKTRREREIELYFDGLPIPRAVLGAGQEPEIIDIRLGEQ